MGNESTADKTLELLGMNKNELREKVIEKAADRLLDGDAGEDDDGYREDMLSKLMDRLREHTKDRIDQTIRDLADEHVLPNVTKYIENLTLQATNKWGEAKGESLTFIEYLEQQGEAYLTEQVNHDGKSREEAGYGWSKEQTRITHLIHRHLQYSINTATKDAMRTVHEALGKGIAETVEIQLAKIVKKLRVDVTTQ